MHLLLVNIYAPYWTTMAVIDVFSQHCLIYPFITFYRVKTVTIGLTHV